MLKPITSLIAREQFPLLASNHELHYLDSAATTPQPDVVLAAQAEFVRTSYGPVHRSVYDVGVAATNAYEGARHTVAQFLGARDDEIIFTKNATEALNLAAWIEAGRLEAGDEILISGAEHHSNLLPWQRVACRRGIVMKWIEVKDGALDMADYQQKVTAKTKLVAITAASNVLGSITPLAQVVAIAHQVGARVIVDAAQSVARLPNSPALCEADYIAFSGHKMYGPTGIGVLRAKQNILAHAEPLHVGGGMVAKTTRQAAMWLDGPARFEGGTPPVVEAIGLAAAISFVQEVGLATIHMHEQSLNAYAFKKMSELPGIRFVGTTDMNSRVGIMAWQTIVDDQPIHSHDVATIANTCGAAIRAGHHCAEPLLTALGLTDVARASWGVYTTSQDVDGLIQALAGVYSTFALPIKKGATVPSL